MARQSNLEKARRPPKKQPEAEYTQLEKQALLEAYAERSIATTVEQDRALGETLLESCFPPQLDFIRNPARQKAALCTRRAGKSFGNLLYMIWICQAKPGANVVYVNKSRLECMNIMWWGPSGLVEANRRWGLGCGLKETEMRVHFPNGSRIQLIGVDDRNRLEALRGPTYDLVVIDEAQAFPDLPYFAKSVILPALMDRRGQLVLIGTPDITCQGYFFDITKPKVENRAKGWAVHQWTYADNVWLQPPLSYVDPITGIQVDVRDEAQETKRLNGWTDETPDWRREYCAEWVNSDEDLVYQTAALLGDFDPEYDEDVKDELGNPVIKRHARYYSELPDDYEHDWQYMIGIDMGMNPKPMAYSVWAYAETCGTAYEIDSQRVPDLIPSEQAKLVQRLMEMYPGARIVADEGNLGKAIAQEWRVTFGLPIDAAQKTNKMAFISMMNNDITGGRIKFRMGSPLVDEHLKLCWTKQRNGQLKEDTRNFQNDISDAALYAWRELATWATQPRKTKIVPFTPEWYAKQEELLEACMNERSQPPIGRNAFQRNIFQDFKPRLPRIN